MRSQNKPSEDIWWQSLQRSPENIPPNADQCNPVLSLPDGKRIQTTSEWSAKRQEIRKKWLSYLGEIPGPDRSEMKWTVLESDDRDGVRRELIRYEAEPGLPIEGYLLRPLNDPPQAVIKPKSLPAVAVFHSTVDYTIRQPAGLEGPQEKWIGLHLAQAGYVTFCPRCYLWQYGEPRNLLKAVNWLNRRHPMVKGMTKMLYDSVRAVDLLLSLPEVNPRRIGSVGHSLGAKEVLYLAAFDERVRATVSSEGGIGIGYSNWNAPWYLDSAITDHKADLNHAELLSLIAPRAFLLMGGDSADGDQSWPYVEANLPLWKLTGEPGALGLWNHKLGHAFPPDAMQHTLQWFNRFLNA